MNAVTADAVSVDVATTETTTSTSYTDLATAGPASAGVPLNAGQGCLVVVSARVSVTSGGLGHQAAMSFAVSGASTQAAADSSAAESQTTTQITVSRVAWFVAAAAGTHVFTAKYKVTSGDTGTYTNRRIVVKPF